MLVLDTLKNALEWTLQSKQTDVFRAARAFADCYVSYAEGAMAGVSLPVFLGTERDLFATSLMPTWSVPAAGTPLTAATALAQAVRGVWTVPPISFAGGAGTGVSVAPMVGLEGALLSVFGPFQTAPVAAASLAGVLDLYTRTVTVTLAPSGLTVVLT